MSTEREREAREHRAKGKELAEGIRADADRQRRVLLAEAFREAEELRGDGDAQAAAIYAGVRAGSGVLFAFHRSLRKPTVRASPTKKMYWCWTQAAISSVIWKSPQPAQ
jgi:regulator of protease activity HflC (stomatin/prohibitin superfamily)